MNTKPNRQAICDALCERAAVDSNIVVLCSDSRGSASITNFIEQFPAQFVEVGIAEQDLVGVSAGLASCGKKAFAVSPACFLAARSYEQIKVDVAYSNTNVKLIGISGGVSYGALGMSHHSTQDIAAMASIPNMRVYLPSDRFQTKALVHALLDDEKPAYLRVGRNAVEDVYTENDIPFVLNRANVLKKGGDIALVACGGPEAELGTTPSEVGETGELSSKLATTVVDQQVTWRYVDMIGRSVEQDLQVPGSVRVTFVDGLLPEHLGKAD